MRSLLLAFLCAGCASSTSQLVEQGPACASFVEHDARTRAELERLLAEAPGDTLVRESSRLNAARRACARHVLTDLLARREALGVEAIQHELDAMTAAYAPDELQAMVVQAFGVDASALAPFLAEARARAARRATTATARARDDEERKKLVAPTPDSMGPPPEVPDTMCDEPTPCAQLRCLAQDAKASPEAAARNCLDVSASLQPLARAKQVAEVLSLLPTTPSGARTEARMQLETLKTQLWPAVEQAVVEKKPGRAAQLASPFHGLPTVSERVAQLRDAAMAHHLARAKAMAGTTDAAWLHRAVAAEFGGPGVPAPEGTGEWQPLRWLCKGEAPELPPLAAGLTGTLTVRCREGERPAQKPRDDAMRTFEFESSLTRLRVEGLLIIACADRSNSYTFKVDEPGIEGFPAEGFRQELARVLERTVRDCAQVHRYAATRSCTELRTLSPEAVIRRFVDHARFLGAWEPCFSEWLEATEGVAPPPPPRR